MGLLSQTTQNSSLLKQNSYTNYGDTGGGYRIGPMTLKETEDNQYISRDYLRDTNTIGMPNGNTVTKPPESKKTVGGVLADIYATGREIVQAPFRNQPLVFGGQDKNLASETAKMIYDVPGRAITVVRGLLSGEEARGGERELSKAEADLYGESTYKTTYKDVQDRIAQGDGATSAYIGAVSTKALDVLFGAQMLRSLAGTGEKVLADILTKKSVPEKIASWKQLGLPSQEELNAAYRQRAMQLHPDVGGDTKAFAELANSKAVIDAAGIPTKAELAGTKLQSGLEQISRETNLGEGGLLTPNLGPKTLVPERPLGGLKALPGTAEVPGQAPALGLSTKKVELVGSEDKSLMAIHNLSEGKLAFAQKIGALVNPSVAVVDIAKQGFTNYGEVSLIASKELLAQGKTFASDIYSPRFPSLTIKISDQGNKILESTLGKYEGISGEKFNNLDLNDFDRTMKNSSLALADFLTKEGVELPKTDISTGSGKYDFKNTLRDIIQEKGLQDRFVDYLTKLKEEIGATEHIFKGFTYSGNRRYAPATVENISKDMKSRGLADKEGMEYGLGSLRAKLVPRLSSIPKIQAAKGRLVTTEEFEKVRDIMNTKYSDILDEYTSRLKKGQGSDNPFINRDEVASGLGDYLTGKFPQFVDRFTSIPQSLVDKTEKFADELKAMPTEYFESKFTRPVKLGEFSHAVVPDTLGADAIKKLEDDGINVVKYKKGDDVDRLAKVKELTQKTDIAFKKKLIGENEGPKMTTQEIRKIIHDEIGDYKVRLIFTDNIADMEGGALGLFKQDSILGDLIKIYTEDGKAGLITAMHEVKHFLFSKLPPEIQKEALALAKAEIGPLKMADLRHAYKGQSEDVILEEYVMTKWAKADASAKYGYKKSAWEKFWYALDDLLKKIVDGYKKIKARVNTFVKEAGGSQRGSIGYRGKDEKIYQKQKAYDEYLQTELGKKEKKSYADYKREKRERGFVTSIKEDLPNLQKIAGQYIPRSTDKLAIKAKNMIKDDIAVAEKKAFTGTDDEAVAVGSELLKHYSEQAAATTDGAIKGAIYDKAAELGNTMAHKLTDLGRSVQAASILGRLTPEGQLRFAAREIQKYNEGLNKFQKKLPELTAEQAKTILDEMTAIGNMGDSVEKGIRFQKLQDYISRLVPTPLFQKIVTVWKAGLLTGMKTTGVNILANLSHAGSELVKGVPATMVDKIVSLFTGKRTTAFTLKGIGTGTVEGANKGFHYLRTGFDERNIGTKLDYNKTNFGKGNVAKALQMYTDSVFRLLGSEDQPFYYAAKIRSFYEQAKAEAINKGLKGKEAQKFIDNLVENPTDEMTKYASVDAETAVFQNKTLLGKAAKKIQEIPGGEIIVPFGRTPSAVAMQVLNYSPVGIAKTIFENAGRGKFDQRQFAQGIGRGLTGIAVLALGAYLFKEGLLTTAKPTGEKEQKLWELEGKQANSIKIGGKWRQVQILGPLGNVMLIGGSFQKAYNNTGTISGAASEGLADASQSFTQQTFLTGVSNFIDAVSDPARSANYVAGSMLASTIPTIVADTARATDTKERRANTIFEKFMARIPGVREKLEPQVDVLGKEKDVIANPLEIMADPTRPSSIGNSPVITELRRLWDVGQKISPSQLGDKTGYKGLTPEQNTEVWRRAGEITNDKLGKLFEKTEYKILSDEKKGKAVNSFVDKSQIAARTEMVLQLTEGISGDTLKQELSRLKQSGLMTEEIFNNYLKLR